MGFGDAAFLLSQSSSSSTLLKIVVEFLGHWDNHRSVILGWSMQKYAAYKAPCSKNLHGS